MIYCYYKTHTGYEFAAEYHCDEDAQRAARGLLEKYGFIYADGLGNATPCDIWAALSKNSHRIFLAFCAPIVSLWRRAESQHPPPSRYCENSQGFRLTSTDEGRLIDFVFRPLHVNQPVNRLLVWCF